MAAQIVKVFDLQIIGQPENGSALPIRVSFQKHDDSLFWNPAGVQLILG